MGCSIWEGQSGEKLRAQDRSILSRFYNDLVHHRPDNAESLEVFNHRVNMAYQQAAEQHNGKHLVIIIIFDAAAGKNSACINNEARYNQARQYGFSEKMSFLPGTNYSDEHPISVSPGANQRGEALLSPLPTLKTQ
ncbi:MAG: histidine phosphatase family protein [Candidatus Thiodiazotropha sp. (ex Lucinoma aequizonata)]|nr:histidine phosphatase family protein [Candidatus Thiodiazotropha sp. (ex Lucinoma aequizonata)]MCU7886826.1 histidine phosphatase family protein [Candidatus Thiodiazotropha sp. (ex Lucinoma aequizonata)]MCU7893567.1 histidine phosphatase family protein [Candidatus Thiodiazotropha sp. (ex Lucinoma aequizonata)]MCU7899923.1 histidine phosphatase family protein [Candidatus Thiodiazotropha sp. (ex Lucinoma aequizonata)]MCU7901026.1 histidine phosphatase family protein [Candidatus Thiodiazotropha